MKIKMKNRKNQIEKKYQTCKSDLVIYLKFWWDKLIIRKGEYLKVNPDIRSVYENLPWDFVFQKQIKISKI